MRQFAFASLLLLIGCGHASAPAPPPPPTLATVTFIWTPDPSATSQEIVCNGMQTIPVPVTAASYTLNLPAGPATCAAQMAMTEGSMIVQLSQSWSGTIQPGAQTVALQLPATH